MRKLFFVRLDCRCRVRLGRPGFGAIRSHAMGARSLRKPSIKPARPPWQRSRRKLPCKRAGKRRSTSSGATAARTPRRPNRTWPACSRKVSGRRDPGLRAVEPPRRTREPLMKMAASSALSRPPCRRSSSEIATGSVSAKRPSARRSRPTVAACVEFGLPGCRQRGVHTGGPDRPGPTVAPTAVVPAGAAPRASGPPPLPGRRQPRRTPRQPAAGPRPAADRSVDLATQSLALSTALIAFVDGFNPCSLWVLSVLLALTLHTGSRKKVFIIGLVFLTVTALVYALFIAGLFTMFTIVSFAAGSGCCGAGGALLRREHQGLLLVQGRHFLHDRR